MKYVFLVGDGMADVPLKELNGKTPLQQANTPNMDYIACHGEVGLIQTLFHGLPTGSDVANLSLLGYDPRTYFTGRAPFESAGMGIELAGDDVAFRANFVTIRNGVMEDYSAGHITNEETAPLIELLNKKLGDGSIRFYQSVSYRNLMVWKDGKDKTVTIPPHDILGKKIAEYLPAGEGAEFLNRIMTDSVDMLSSSEINAKREKEGKNPANMLWLWGQGKKPNLPGFAQRYGGKRAVVVAAVDLIKGICASAGFDKVDVKGATGYLDTDYGAKGKTALEMLKKYDFVFVHVEAPDEASHAGDFKEKIRAIENFDKFVVGRILDGLKNSDIKEYKVLLTADHVTPVYERTHTTGNVPVAIYDSRKSVSGSTGFDEFINTANQKIPKEAHRLMDYFIG